MKIKGLEKLSRCPDAHVFGLFLLNIIIWAGRSNKLNFQLQMPLLGWAWKFKF